MKRRRRCINPSALSWGLHSSCRGRPMILFTIFILIDLQKVPRILYSIPGIRANSFRTVPIPFWGFSSTPKLFVRGRRQAGGSGGPGPARRGGGGERRAAPPLLSSPQLLSLTERHRGPRTGPRGRLPR